MNIRPMAGAALLRAALSALFAFLLFAFGVHRWQGASVGFLRVYQPPQRILAALLFIGAAFYAFTAVRHLVAAFTG